MAAFRVAGDTPVEITLRTDSGPATYLGQLLGLAQTEAAVKIETAKTWTHLHIEPSFLELCRPALPVAVVFKGAAETVVDIVPASVADIAVDQDGSPTVSLQFARGVRWVERRAAPRRKCRLPVAFLPVKYQSRNLPRTVKRGTGHILDLSVGGAKLRTDLRLPVQLRIEMWLQTPGEPWRIVAEIVNVQDIAGERCYGLRFVQADPRGASFGRRTT